MQNKRIHYMDFLKFICLMCIILAHVGPPVWIMMLRSFDVPFMVIISSILANKSFSKYEKNNSSKFLYFFSRAKRLVIPTWIFLIIYFILLFIYTGKAETIQYYFASFCLTRYGIGYVWIILIYLYCAALIPLFAKLRLSTKGICIIFLSYIIYEVAYYYKVGLTGGIAKSIIDTTFYYIIPYGVLAYLGYNYYTFKRNTKYIIFSVSLIIFVGLAIYYFIATGSPQPVSITKYPPRLYYMSYGITCSFGLLKLCENSSFIKFDNKIITYISTHSMWIYLWHILALTVYDGIGLPEIWYIKLIIVSVSSILIVIATNKIYDYLDKKHQFSLIKYLRG